MMERYKLILLILLCWRRPNALTKGFLTGIAPATILHRHNHHCTSIGTTTLTKTTTCSLESVKFAMFDIPESDVVYQTTHSAAFCHSLDPVVETGHILCIPQRVTASLKDLSDEEYSDLSSMVQKVKAALERHHGAAAFNVATQWGNSSQDGATPHVHVHVLPRSTGNFAKYDDVYAELAQWAPTEQSPRQTAPSGAVVSTAEEAESYRRYFL